jgi:hypothetical protein
LPAIFLGGGQYFTVKWLASADFGIAAITWRVLPEIFQQHDKYPPSGQPGSAAAQRRIIADQAEVLSYALRIGGFVITSTFR